jgi:hypothetical protein
MSFSATRTIPPKRRALRSFMEYSQINSSVSLKPTKGTTTTTSNAPAPNDWPTWLATLFPDTYSGPLAPFHADFWDWVWDIQPGHAEQPRPYVAVWPRGWAKSTNGEVACVALAAHERKYVLYVCGTQAQADDHITSISEKLASENLARFYPDLASARVQVIGDRSRQLGWRHNRLWTASGFAVDALGLDKAIRGAKLFDQRPDVIIFDDIDATTDSPETIQKKISAVTTKILPAAAPNVVVMVLQNLVHRNGIVSQLADGRADFLARRIISGPHPAVTNMEWEGQGKDAVITGGTPTWELMGLDVCQAKIGLFGLAAFRSECQHEIALSGQPRFNLDALEYQRAGEPLPDRALPQHLRGIEGFRVYALPIPGAAYVQYTDPAEGKGRDYTGTGWMDARTLQIVAVLEDNTREPQKHADLAVDIGEWYNRPLTGFERAKGEAIALVFGRRGVPRLYEHVDNPNTPQQWTNGIEEKRRPGFPMTEQSKRGLIDRLADRIDSMATQTPDARMLEQARSYIVTERMTTEAEAGGHDDLVYVWAGCLMLAEQPGAQSLMTTPGDYEMSGSAQRGWGWGQRR